VSNIVAIQNYLIEVDIARSGEPPEIGTYACVEDSDVLMVRSIL
jgi:hypothetical protein